MYVIQQEQNTSKHVCYLARAKHILTCLLSSKSKIHLNMFIQQEQTHLNMYIIQQEQNTSEHDVIQQE